LSYGAGKLAAYYPAHSIAADNSKTDAGSTAYEITDHLGNVRALLRVHANEYTATMEDDGTAAYTNPRVRENVYFKNLFETEKRDVQMNHTSSAITPSPNTSSYLYWIDGQAGMTADKKSVGPAIALSVSAGDQVDLSAWARFKNKNNYTKAPIKSIIANVLAGQYAFSNGLESVAQAATNFNAGLTGLVATNETDTDRPYAYLNYIVFNSSYVKVDGGAQRVPLEAGFEEAQRGSGFTDNNLVKFVDPISISQTGYVYVWVSNESEATEVWFDDVSVVHRKPLLAQATDYESWGGVLREQRWEDLDARYRYSFQGQFNERDEETSWHHYELREYDDIIGRWTSIDPKRAGFSPYIGMGNNPVNKVDPDGGCPDGDCDPIDLGTLPEGIVVTAPRYFGGGVFDRAVDSWLNRGKNYSTYGRINFGVYETPDFDFNLNFQGKGVAINLVAVVGVSFALDRVETIDNGAQKNDLYFTLGPSLGLDISADVHGAYFLNSDNSAVSSGDVGGLQYSMGGGNGPFGYQRAGSITFDRGLFNPAFGNTTSHQLGIGAGPSSLSPWSGTVGVSYTINLSNVARRLNSVFK
jgi:RHS repeat-associated protein